MAYAISAGWSHAGHCRSRAGLLAMKRRAHLRITAPAEEKGYLMARAPG